MRIADIDFPNELITSLSDGDLVVFAGAGVSMGKPACLPDFNCLAKQVANGTGEELGDDDPDRFLGRLKNERGVEVHRRVAEILGRDNIKATSLHYDLLRLYLDPSKVRVVTTNFDLLFKSASQKVFEPDLEVFKSDLEVFRYPALPLASEFNGIVHLHGSIVKPKEMILTDEDFGRAYLTEGSARRFLVDLFRSSTVLFVGYSHTDTIMTYLARALMPSDLIKRFVLTSDDETGRWESLGIKPIPYHASEDSGHAALYEGVDKLARVIRRGVLEWKKIITDIARNAPSSLSDENISNIEYAFKDKTRTGFFTEEAVSPEWINWLDERDYLDKLFEDTILNETDVLLCQWLVKRFAISHSNHLFDLITQHNTHLNPKFWHSIVGWIYVTKSEGMDRCTLSRWVSVLLNATPSDLEYAQLELLCDACSTLQSYSAMLQIFDFIQRKYATSDTVKVHVRTELDYWTVNHIWKETIKPELPLLCCRLLELTVCNLELRYETQCFFGRASQEHDFWRAAIKPHKENLNYEISDVLIDIARDCLEHIVSDGSGTAEYWCVRLSRSDSPTLRRLSVHTISVRTDLDADAKIKWLLKHLDIHETAIRPEVFDVMKLAYADAAQPIRKCILNSVNSYQWHDASSPNRADFTDYHRFEWLHWLHNSAPECDLTREAWDGIVSCHPDWRPDEEPGITFRKPRTIEFKAPMSVEQLISRPPSDWIDYLLAFQEAEGEGSVWFDRDMLLKAVKDAAMKNPSWGIELGEILRSRGETASDLWQHLLMAWHSSELDEAKYRQIFKLLTVPELQSAHARNIACLLFSIVENGAKPYAISLLDRSNQLASEIWEHLDQHALNHQNIDKFHTAINHPAGTLAQYWLAASSIWRQNQHPVPNLLNDIYKDAMLAIIQNNDTPGELGKSVFASRFPYLLYADRDWTIENVLPLFKPGHHAFEAAWSGFYYAPPLTTDVADLMEDMFLLAVQRIDGELANIRHEFVHLYSSMVMYHVEKPLDRWITTFFEHATTEDRCSFASKIEWCLRDLNDTVQREWWDRWLKQYWMNRLDGIPKSLEKDEIIQMLFWVPRLTTVFEDAVELAARMPTVPIEESNFFYFSKDLIPEGAVQDHPEATARWLIYLGERDVKHPFIYSHWDGADEIIDQLIASDISHELKCELEELKLTLGMK